MKDPQKVISGKESNQQGKDWQDEFNLLAQSWAQKGLCCVTRVTEPMRKIRPVGGMWLCVPEIPRGSKGKKQSGKGPADFLMIAGGKGIAIECKASERFHLGLMEECQVNFLDCCVRNGGIGVIAMKMDRRVILVWPELSEIILDDEGLWIQTLKGTK